MSFLEFGLANSEAFILFEFFAILNGFFQEGVFICEPDECLRLPKLVGGLRSQDLGKAGEFSLF